MNNRGVKVRRQVIEIIFLAIIIVATFYWYMRGYSFEELRNVLKNADRYYLITGALMMFLFVCCEAINIYLILKALRQNTPMLRCIQYSYIGFYFSSITPSASGGQPAQIYYMKKDKISVPISSITMFYILFVYQISMILMGMIMSFFRFPIFVHFINRIKFLFLFGIIVNTGVIFLIFLLMFSKKWIPTIIRFMTKLLNKLHIVRKKDIIIEKMETGLTSYHEKALVLKRYPVLFFKVLFVTMIQMLAINLIPYLVYRSMGYHDGNMMDLLTSQSLLTISVSAIPLPGAEGVSQGGFLQVYDVFFREDAIVSAMLIHRILSFYLPLILSFILTIFTHLRTATQNDRGDNIEG